MEKKPPEVIPWLLLLSDQSFPGRTWGFTQVYWIGEICVTDFGDHRPQRGITSRFQLEAPYGVTTWHDSEHELQEQILKYLAQSSG